MLSTNEMRDLDVLQLAALEALMGVFARFKQHMQRALAAHGEGVPPPMVLRLLQLCDQQPGITPSGLVGATGRDKAQITRMVKTLLDDGYLKRQAHPEDRRSHCLWPTPRGMAMVKVFAQAQAQVAAELFGACSSAQLEGLIQQWAALGQPPQR